MTVTGSFLVKRVITSLLSLACPRTFTLLAMTTAGPGISGTVRNSVPGSFFLAALLLFFFAVFFFSALAVTLFVFAAVGALVAGDAAAAVSSPGDGGAFVACWASKLVEITAVKISK